MQPRERTRGVIADRNVGPAPAVDVARVQTPAAGEQRDPAEIRGARIAAGTARAWITIGIGIAIAIARRLAVAVGRHRIRGGLLAGRTVATGGQAHR